MLRIAVTQALLIGLGAGCAPIASEPSIVPVAMRPKADPIPMAKASVLAEVYGQLLALARPCPALRSPGQRFRQHVISNAGIGRSVEDALQIRSAMDRAFAQEAPRWRAGVPPEACAKAGRLLEATRSNENDRISALAGIW